MKNNTKLTLQIYWAEARQRRLLVFLILVCVIGGSSMGVIIPLYFKRFFDLLSANGTKGDIANQLILILISIAGIELIRWVFWRIAIFANAIFQSEAIAHLANRCFKYLHRHSFSYFNANFVGSLVKRVNWFTRAFESVSDKIIWSILPLITDVGIVIAVLTQRNTLLGLTLVGWMGIFLLVNYLLTKYKLKYDILRNKSETKAAGVLADTITNSGNVKLFNGYSQEVENYGRVIDRVRKLRRFTWNLDGLFDGAQGFLVIILEIVIFYLAIRLWQRGVLSLGDFVLIQSYIIILFEKVWDFGKMIRFLYSDLADAEEMTVILNTPHEIQDTASARPLAVTTGKIEFQNVVFHYHETRKIIGGLNLIIAPGEKIALVGPSGAGKSTIIKLLLRMHDITGGAILIDGQRTSDVTQESLWRAISFVPQDPILFHRTLMENIRYGRAEATDAQVFAAARQAHCNEFIREFPDGYNTYVGERGVKLSGGERQRVAIARAILRGAPILVLDEATSSLDSESEALIQEALNTLMNKKTVIVIAHRLSTIMKMDRIAVVNRGEIVEEGTHAKLLKLPRGMYRQLWKLQAGGFMPDQPPETSTEEALKEIEQRHQDEVKFIEQENIFVKEVSPPVEPPPL